MPADIEISLYRCLGIRIFQKIIFVIEKCRHRKDGGRNSNYHLYDLSSSRISVHFAFLSYNALIHLISQSITLSLFIVRRADAQPWAVVDGFLLFAVIANSYCIMLQRYNALRLKQMQLLIKKKNKRKIERKADLLRRHIPEKYDRDLRAADLIWLSGLADAVGQCRDYIIEESDSCRMERLADWKEYAGLSDRIVKKDLFKQEYHQREKEFHYGSCLYSGAEQRVDCLQSLFRISSGRILDPWSIATTGPRSEKAFIHLFQFVQADAILELTAAFLQADLVKETDIKVLSHDHCSG